MNTTQAVTYKETDFFFVALGTAESPMPRQIDSVMEGSDGTRLGRFSGENREQLGVRYKAELVEMEWSELVKQQAAALRSDPKEITEKDWDYALNVLPPMHWGRWSGVESFCMSEFYSGNMTTIYAKHAGKFWSFMDDAYMGGEAIAHKVAGAARAAA